MSQQAVRRRCLALLNGSHADADDAVATTAMKAFEHYASLRNPVVGTPWLLTIARNVCLDLHRGNRRRRLVEVSLQEEHLDVSAIMPVEPPELADDAERDDDACEVLRRSIERLPQRLRAVARLRFVSSLRSVDIARELGMTDANVRKQLQHIRERLRGSDAPRERSEEPAIDGAADRERDERRRIFSFPVTSGGVTRDALLVLRTAITAPGAGIDSLARYLAEHPRGWRARLRFARALAAAGRFGEAVEQYGLALAKQPYPLEPWLELADVLLLLGCHGAAIAACQRGANAVGRAADRSHLRGRAAAIGGDRDAALEHFDAAAAADPENALHALARGETLLAAGRPREAQEALARAVALDPADPLAPVPLHDALRELGCEDAAKLQIDAALVRDPRNVAAIERLLLDELLASSPDAAREPAAIRAAQRTLRRIAPAHAGVAIAEAILARSRGSVAAERSLLDFLECHPDHAVARRALAEIHNGPGAASTACP